MSCNSDHHDPHSGHDVARPHPSGEIIDRLGRPTLSGQEITIDVVPRGPSLAVTAGIARTLTNDWLRREAGTADLRLLSVQLVEDDDKDRPASSDRFLAHVYDYTNNRTLHVCGHIDRPDRASVVETAAQPLPSDEEFEAAVELLANQPEYGAAIRGGQLLPYRPMPPLVTSSATT
jgi:hypothetical protein